MDTKIKEYRAELVRRRESLRGGYARYRELGHMAMQKMPHAVGYSKEKHEYYQANYFDVSHKERETAKMLLKLQKNIQQQAMLVLELEHAIDREEKSERDRVDATASQVPS